MTATLTRYAREAATYTQAEIDAAVAAGTAKFFEAAGIYVLKRPEGGSVKVTRDQIVAPFEDDNAAEAALADAEAYFGIDEDQAYYEAKADAQGISVEELTDGEYRDSRTQTRASRAARIDELMARWT